jgi:hypothetical protein
MANYLITGFWGEPHVTAENDRGINAAMFGGGRKVLPVGEMLRAEYIGNNTIRMYDGKLIDGGAIAGIPAGEFIDLYIPEAGQGMKRNDLIVFRYAQDASTMIESGTFEVLPGAESSSTPTDPALTQEDILLGSATGDQMALWRVSVSGAAISAPVQLFEVYEGGGKVTKEAVEEVLTGNITTHTHSQYLTSHQDISGKLNKSGGTMTGKLIAQNNTDYTTKQVRNMIFVAEGSSIPSSSNGDFIVVYEP